VRFLELTFPKKREMSSVPHVKRKVNGTTEITGPLLSQLSHPKESGYPLNNNNMMLKKT